MTSFGVPAPHFVFPACYSPSALYLIEFLLFVSDSCLLFFSHLDFPKRTQILSFNCFGLFPFSYLALIPARPPFPVTSDRSQRCDHVAGVCRSKTPSHQVELRSHPFCRRPVPPPSSRAISPLLFQTSNNRSVCLSTTSAVAVIPLACRLSRKLSYPLPASKPACFYSPPPLKGEPASPRPPVTRRVIAV